MPTTVHSMPSRRYRARRCGIAIEARAPKRLAHHDDWGALRSSSENVRPAIGLTPRTSKIPAVTHCRETVSALPSRACHHHSADAAYSRRSARTSGCARSSRACSSGEAKPASRFALGGFPDRDQPIRIGVGQRPEERRVDKREDCAVAADAKRQRRIATMVNTGECELPEREFQIVTSFEPLASPACHVLAFFQG